MENEFGKSLVFSTAWGMEGLDGKERINGWMIEGWVLRRGVRNVWFFGVVRMVMVMFLSVVASLWVRSRRGIMWP